jgi:hypothetical protein
MALAPGTGKHTLAPNHWGQLFYIAVNGAIDKSFPVRFDITTLARS